MNIGIMVHSPTGHTKTAALVLEKKLKAAGHSVRIEEIITTGRAQPGDTNITLKTNPKVEPYDGLVFAAPVMAFSLCPGMKLYISGVSSLKNKKVAFLCTKQLPFSWTGGNQAVGWMKNQCTSRGATICGKGIVFWGSEKRDYYIDKAASDITDSF